MKWLQAMLIKFNNWIAPEAQTLKDVTIYIDTINESTMTSMYQILAAHTKQQHNYVSALALVDLWKDRIQKTKSMPDSTVLLGLMHFVG